MGGHSCAHVNVKPHNCHKKKKKKQSRKGFLLLPWEGNHGDGHGEAGMGLTTTWDNLLLLQEII